jgi:hypothetical protein
MSYRLAGSTPGPDRVRLWISQTWGAGFMQLLT